MPGCSVCIKQSGGRCLAYEQAKQVLRRELPPPPVGACMLPIVEEYLDLIVPRMRVLEIGCGSWNWITNRCAEVGAEYEGIDVQATYHGVPSVATRIENLAHLSFPDEHFDIVIGNQTMEHWPEWGCSLDWGLYQCFRVTKTGGRVLLNVPIHFHGHRYFLMGNLSKVREKLTRFASDIQFEPWGNPSDPLPAYQPYRHYWKLRQKSAYILDIRAVKDRHARKPLLGPLALRGRAARLTSYPLSFTFFQVLRKAGLYPAM